MDFKTENFSDYQIRRLRLINFHNFTDETINVQGSLFLIGNNGTGKTTILDAIHLVLTGGQQLTYNAATIFGPRSQAGRTLAGVILRHDFESGKTDREEGAIGYAAMELVHSKSNHVITVGVGAFVQGMDQRPDTWGFVSESSLDKIPLTISVKQKEKDEAQHRPVDKKELTELVGNAHVYDIGRYRTQIANRFFGGRENFERIADLLKASKSYKELVVKARDFEGLFAFLLPAPDHQVFQDIESTLQSLGKIESDLKALRQEKDLLEEAMNVVERIGNARENVLRYRFLQTRAAFENVDKEATRIQRAIHRNEQNIADSQAQLETVIPQLEKTRNILSELRIGEPARLLEELHRLEQEKLRVSKELQARTAEIDAESTKLSSLKRDVRRASLDLSEALQNQLQNLEKIEWPSLAENLSVKKCDSILSSLKEEYRAIDTGSEIDIQKINNLLNSLFRELDVIISKIREKQQPLLLKKAELDRSKRLVSNQTIGAGDAVEFLPEVPSYADFAAELDSKSIDWLPLYRLVDFKKDTPPEFVDALEAYLGEAFLGTVFVEPEILKSVVDITFSKYPDLIIADTAALKKMKAPHVAANSVCKYIDAGKNPLVKKFLDINLGDVSVEKLSAKAKGESWISLDGIAYKGKAMRRLAQPARGLLGSDRRQNAIEIRQNERRAKLAEFDAQINDVTERLELFKENERTMSELRRGLEERVKPWLVTHRLLKVKSSSSQLEEVKERISRLKKNASRIQKQITQFNEQIETIKQNEKAQTTGDIGKQIDHLRKQVVSLERERDKSNELIARYNERLDIAREQLTQLDTHRQEVEAALNEQREALKEAVSIEHKADLDHYVDVVCDSRSVKVSQINQNIREQERFINREIGSLIGLESDEHKGRGGLLHHELLWTKYAFVYDEATNVLKDQNDKTAAELFGKIETEMESLESVVSEKRRKLLEKTILGDLSNQYTRDLYRLRESLNAVNHMLEGLTFGRTQYKFTQKIKNEYRQMYGIVRRAGAIDAESQRQLKTFFESRLEQLRIQPDGSLPKFLDYRHWFDYQLHVKTVGKKDGIELTNDIRKLGSGGEQAVPNYLLIMSMSALLFNQIGSKVRVLLFDEAFYGIDSARRDELLKFAACLGVHLIVATPEMDGVTDAMRQSTTLLLEKNAQNEVFVGNFVWESQEGAQLDIFKEEEKEENFEISIGKEK